MPIPKSDWSRIVSIDPHDIHTHTHTNLYSNRLYIFKGQHNDPHSYQTKRPALELGRRIQNCLTPLSSDADMVYGSSLTPTSLRSLLDETTDLTSNFFKLFPCHGSDKSILCVDCKALFQISGSGGKDLWGAYWDEIRIACSQTECCKKRGIERKS